MKLNDPSLEKLAVIPIGEDGTSSDGVQKIVGKAGKKNFQGSLVDARVVTNYQKTLKKGTITRTALVHAIGVGHDNHFSNTYTGGGIWDLGSEGPVPALYVVDGPYRNDGNSVTAIRLDEVESFETL
ncbi:hypothetical protein K8R33_03350 [archaeon]|nr:hypothetical protein [archaeon]